MRIDHSLRTYIIFGIMIIFVVLIVGRLFFIQIVYSQSYKDRADRQYVTQVSSLYNRGSIFFKKKDGAYITAAGLKEGYTIAINPKKISDANIFYKKISSVIPIDKELFFKKARKKDDPYEEIYKRATKEDVKKIKDLNLKGINIFKERWRYYPAGRTASQLLGFVGYTGNNIQKGVYGLERYYDDTLSRSDNGLYINFFAEIFSNITNSIFSADNTREGDVVLTIEPNVQVELENILKEVKAKWSSDLVGGIIINPNNGSIYAMSALPDFDPNNFSSEKKSSSFSNPLVERVYEMGSIVKPLTMAAAVDAGVVDSTTKYNDKGFMILDGYKIANYDGRARGVVNIQQILSQSLNMGAVFLMRSLGREKFSKYMLSYGIGEETGIEIPNETRGLVSNLKSRHEIEYATSSFGQGIAMTPIETARALSSLANGGLLVSPFIVDRIDYRVGGSKKTYPDEGKRILKNTTSEEVTRMLVRVVDEALLNGKVALPKYSIAAKTGTAQIADNKNGGYYNDRYLHSFFGYFPAYSPKFLVFLYNVNPKKVKYASQTLTYPFMDITKFLLNYYEVQPDR
jgi:cell division protein FtsI/penicillin-binding protein 2